MTQREQKAWGDEGMVKGRQDRHQTDAIRGQLFCPFHCEPPTTIICVAPRLKIKQQSGTMHHSLADLIINPDDRIDIGITLED